MVFELTKAGARFLVVGAHALSVHGVPRATKDLDVWVDSSPDNAERVMAALRGFGAPVEALRVSIADLTNPDSVIQFGVEPYRIDIMTGVSGVTFEEAWPERVTADFLGVVAPFISRADFIRNKRSSGRLKDLGDIEGLGENPRGG